MAGGRFVGSVGITGMGYAGLPPAPAEAGLSVVGIEKDPDKVAPSKGATPTSRTCPPRAWSPSSGRMRATENCAPRAGCPAH